ncbi:hypothetical protein [Pseudoalteromonas sp. McH1-42]|uniref:hypothetical protein n=1 Tax=Pseudoalteromonas sp. McH1-42 TaxID=2917752 RepID=UPI001EF67FF9|nr:hypothetical protein [Pseudoalteromonas sp. McH1-42]MCG7564203.1 hypothetical protein [Pseudoalteromonas sp. McH1-42]
MEIDYIKIGVLLASLFSILATFSVARLTRKHSTLEGNVNRQHAETLATLNHVYSKEAHASNHLYTRKATHLESAAKIVGELEFWAEKCVVPRTRTDFGTKQEIAAKMSMAFEDLTKHTMHFPFAFKEIPDFQKNLGDLMGAVNYIENMVHSKDFSASSQAWNEAVEQFRFTLSPLISGLHKEIDALMQQT